MALPRAADCCGYAEIDALADQLRVSAATAPPVVGGGVNRSVVVEIEVSRVLMDLDRHAMFLSVQLTQTWHDSRLSWDPAAYCGQAVVELQSDGMWTPGDRWSPRDQDVQYGGNGGSKYDGYDTRILMVSSGGTMVQTLGIRVSSVCVMDFSMAPFDHHTCTVRVEAREPRTRFELAAPGAVRLGEGRVKDEVSITEVWAADGGVYASFEQRRTVGKVIVNYFVPLWLILILSYAGLWVDPASPPARATMAITTVLVLVAFNMRAIDSSVNITLQEGYKCITYVCCTANAAEFVLVNYLLHRLRDRGEQIRMRREFGQGLARETTDPHEHTRVGLRHLAECHRVLQEHLRVVKRREKRAKFAMKTPGMRDMGQTWDEAGSPGATMVHHESMAFASAGAAHHDSTVDLRPSLALTAASPANAGRPPVPAPAANDNRFLHQNQRGRRKRPDPGLPDWVVRPPGNGSSRDATQLADEQNEVQKTDTGVTLATEMQAADVAVTVDGDEHSPEAIDRKQSLGTERAGTDVSQPPAGVPPLSVIPMSESYTVGERILSPKPQGPAESQQQDTQEGAPPQLKILPLDPAVVEVHSNEPSAGAGGSGLHIDGTKLSTERRRTQWAVQAQRHDGPSRRERSKKAESGAVMLRKLLQRAELEEAFDIFNESHTGVLTIQERYEVLESLGINDAQQLVTLLRDEESTQELQVGDKVVLSADAPAVDETAPDYDPATLRPGEHGTVVDVSEDEGAEEPAEGVTVGRLVYVRGERGTSKMPEHLLLRRDPDEGTIVLTRPCRDRPPVSPVSSLRKPIWPSRMHSATLSARGSVHQWLPPWPDPNEEQESELMIVFRTPLKVNGEVWPSIEHFYQAMKFPEDPQAQDEIRQAVDCTEAFDLGNDNREDRLFHPRWEEERGHVLLAGLRLVCQEQSVRDAVLRSGDRLIRLKDENEWWGTGPDGTGCNHFGLKLMAVRAELRNHRDTLELEQELKRLIADYYNTRGPYKRHFQITRVGKVYINRHPTVVSARYHYAPVPGGPSHHHQPGHDFRQFILQGDGHQFRVMEMGAHLSGRTWRDPPRGDSCGWDKTRFVHLMEKAGVHQRREPLAITFLSRPLTRTGVLRLERRYRSWAPVFPIVCTVVWLAILLSQ